MIGRFFQKEKGEHVRRILLFLLNSPRLRRDVDSHVAGGH